MKLPYLTKNLPRFIGEIKVLPEHFEVEEVPLYPACGEGQHIYVNVTRKNYNTKEIAFSLKKLFCVSECDVGCAGLKDKNAQATQTFSLSLGVTYEQDRAVELINKNLPDLTINWVLRHKNKLKTGHLLGNKFKILVTTDDPQALKKSNDIYQQLGGIGFANYFGPQRFGSKGDNAINGKEILLGNKKKSKKTASFLLSAYQSYLFNLWLAQRITDELYDEQVEGDVYHGSRDEKIYTGPIFGPKMIEAQSIEKLREESILTKEEVTINHFKRCHCAGGRRIAKLKIPDLQVKQMARGLSFTFFLPKGAYATSVLREFLV